MTPTITRCFPGRFTCLACGRIGGVSRVVASVAIDNHFAPQANGLYHPTCAGKELLNIIAAEHGLDIAVCIDSEWDYNYYRKRVQA